MANKPKTTREQLEVLIDEYDMRPIDIAARTKTTPWSVTRWHKGTVANPLRIYADAIEKLYEHEVAKRSAQ